VKIDSWDGETVSLEIDGAEVWSVAYSATSRSDGEEQCGKAKTGDGWLE
jgi:hypothetical protein